MNRLFPEAITKTIRDVTETGPTTCIQFNIGSGMLFIEPCRHNKSGASSKTQRRLHVFSLHSFFCTSIRDGDIVHHKSFTVWHHFYYFPDSFFFLLSPPKAELCTRTDKLAAH